MLRRSIATPCPVARSLDDILRGEAENTTTTIDFTTELGASLRDVKPRRKHRPSVQFSIHEDQGEEEDVHRPGRTVLSQPPRRVKPIQSYSVEELQKTEVQESQYTQQPPGYADQLSASVHRSHGLRLGQAPKRPAARLSVLPESATKDITAWLKPPSPKAARPARRGTIYIPNDDTTMPSMYMGIFSPIKDADLESSASCQEVPQVELTESVLRTTAKRGPRMSLIGTAPRRAPLQQSTHLFQESTTIPDRRGQGGGKENVPPGATESDKSHSHATIKTVKSAPRRMSMFSGSVGQKERSNLYAPTKSSVLKRDGPRIAPKERSFSRPAWNGGTTLKGPRPAPIIPKVIKPALSTNITTAPLVKAKVPTRFVIPTIQPEQAIRNHSLLTEDLVNPVLYENDWLQHQEIAMTQLVNNLFTASLFDEEYDQRSLRRQLIVAYNTSSITLMYKRLQAALLYGSLGIPHEVLRQGARLQSDIGLKRQFTDLWLCTYDLATLEIALEVVVGRECHSSQLRTSEGNPVNPKVSKSGLRKFIEAFIIRNEDGKPDAEASSRDSWSYQRTVLRSLMLVKVLDMVKTERSVHMKGCLFQSSSPFKSSISVVQTLMQMLNPAAGDSIRALSHIDYKVANVQHPLQEYHYRIDNLAVDLRDGICLTRLVELLLYPSASQALEKSYDVDNTTTLMLPEGEILQITDGQDWPLSQHLKMTCQSRAVKIWNVEVALSAIRNIKGVGHLIDGISSNDIVDGFREKTIRLLWALIGKWGLVGLLNWHDIRWEIKRLEKLNAGLADADDEFDEETQDENWSFESCKATLKRWARTVAQSKGVKVHNFTTSFSNGKAFEAIVDEYEQYIEQEQQPSHSKPSLQDRLTRLGCSTQFSQLFATRQTGHVFDRDFVLASLAFLCSRLLAPSQRARAATVIQTAWRKHWSTIADVRKQDLKTVALACAEAVRARHRTADSKSVTTAAPSALIAISPNEFVRDHANSSAGILSPSADEDIWLSL